MHRRVRFLFTVFALTALACNLPFSVQQQTPTILPPTAGPQASIGGTWAGTLAETGGDLRAYDVSLEIQELGQGIFGGTFMLVSLKESYGVEGTFDGRVLRFSEKNGRYFQGTLDGDRITGQVAWDCFDCAAWAQFSLARDGSPSASSQPESASPEFVSPGLLRFVTPTDGGSLAVSGISPAGLPVAEVVVEVVGTTLPLGLEADGLQVAMFDSVTANEAGLASMIWNPWHGNGTYKLTVEILDWDNTKVIDRQTVTVQVKGIPDGTPTLTQRLIQIYQEKFGLHLTAPAFARYNKLFEEALDDSRWVSTAYIANTMYELNIFDDGVIQDTRYDINTGENGMCRPAGRLRILAVIVDYGNTGLSETQAVDALRRGEAQANQRWAEYIAGGGLGQAILQAEAILQTETTIAFIPAPPSQADFMTAEQILSQTGYRTSDFDLVAEIDLDANNTNPGKYGGLGVALYGACRPGGSNRVNMGFAATDRAGLESSLPGSMYEHELTHNLGWMHWWPNEDSSNRAWLNMRNYWMPTLLFGWTDTDGDGTIEILDQTPYGILP